MQQALMFHIVCLPPVEGACVDRSKDKRWVEGASNMTQALDQSRIVFRDVVDGLLNFVEKEAIVVEIQKSVREGVDSNSKPDNQIIATKIKEFFEQKTPDYHFSVIVSRIDPDVWSANILRDGCD
jgi:hypothetical protein